MLTVRGMKHVFDNVKDKADWKKGVVRVINNPGLKQRKDIEQAVKHYTKSDVVWEPVSKGRVRMTYRGVSDQTTYLIL